MSHFLSSCRSWYCWRQCSCWQKVCCSCWEDSSSHFLPQACLYTVLWLCSCPGRCLYHCRHSFHLHPSQRLHPDRCRPQMSLQLCRCRMLWLLHLHPGRCLIRRLRLILHHPCRRRWCSWMSHCRKQSLHRIRLCQSIRLHLILLQLPGQCHLLWRYRHYRNPWLWRLLCRRQGYRLRLFRRRLQLPGRQMCCSWHRSGRSLHPGHCHQSRQCLCHQFLLPLLLRNHCRMSHFLSSCRSWYCWRQCSFLKRVSYQYPEDSSSHFLPPYRL